MVTVSYSQQSSFLWYTPSSGYCSYGNCAAGSKPI